MPPENQGVKLPWKLLISAFVASLIGLGGWSLHLERGKADKTEVSRLREETLSSLATIQADIKTLLGRK